MCPKFTISVALVTTSNNQIIHSVMKLKELMCTFHKVCDGLVIQPQLNHCLA